MLGLTVKASELGLGPVSALMILAQITCFRCTFTSVQWLDICLIRFTMHKIQEHHVDHLNSISVLQL